MPPLTHIMWEFWTEVRGSWIWNPWKSVSGWLDIFFRLWCSCDCSVAAGGRVFSETWSLGFSFICISRISSHVTYRPSPKTQTLSLCFINEKNEMNGTISSEKENRKYSLQNILTCCYYFWGLKGLCRLMIMALEKQKIFAL